MKPIPFEVQLKVWGFAVKASTLKGAIPPSWGTLKCSFSYKLPFKPNWLWDTFKIRDSWQTLGLHYKYLPKGKVWLVLEYAHTNTVELKVIGKLPYCKVGPEIRRVKHDLLAPDMTINCTQLHCTAMNSKALHLFALHCIALHRTTLLFTALH